MKLDVSTLTRPTRIERGQPGTAGTRAFMRASASPAIPPSWGTAGDKPDLKRATRLQLTECSAARPCESSASPLGQVAEMPHSGAVSPVSPVSPFVPNASASASALSPTVPKALESRLTGEHSSILATETQQPRKGAGVGTVNDGLPHRSGSGRSATACTPTRAGVRGRLPTLKPDRPYRLTQDRASRCHTPCWNDVEIHRFQMREGHFGRLGIADHDASDLAEWLTLRDRNVDDRRLCLECRELARSGRCGAASRGAMRGVSRNMAPVPDVLMRCPHFQPAAEAHLLNQGAEDEGQQD
jgi:hypothetical protein